MKTRVGVFVLMVALILPMGSAMAAGASMDVNGGFTLPYLEYNGTFLKLQLDFYQHPSDSASLYWKFRSVDFTAAQGPCGGSIDASLDITDVCVLFAGVQVRIDLDYYANPHDPSGFYWKLGKVEILEARIRQITGASDCIDPEQYVGIYSCILACGMDTDCMLGCFGGLFPLQFTFNNPTSQTIEFTIPPGTLFIPANSSTQTMIVIHEPPITLPPGVSRHCINTFCTEATDSAPGDSDAFVNGRIADRPCLTEIIELTVGKDLSGANFKIQEIIWKCTEDNTISSADRTYLQNLPAL